MWVDSKRYIATEQIFMRCLLAVERACDTPAHIGATIVHY